MDSIILVDRDDTPTPERDGYRVCVADDLTFAEQLARLDALRQARPDRASMAPVCPDPSP